jgi:hypothetical protein
VRHRQHHRQLVKSTSQVSFSTTLFLGFMSSLTVLLFFYLCSEIGWSHFSPAAWIGETLFDRSDRFGRHLGLTTFVFEGSFVALFYAMIFRSAHRSGALVGIHLSIFHYVVAALLASLSSLGPFAMNLGAIEAFFFLTGHFVYGATLGFLFDKASTQHEFALPLNADPQKQV